MPDTMLRVAAGDRLELWLRRRAGHVAGEPAFVIRGAGVTLLRIDAPPDYFQFFGHRFHVAGDVEIAWTTGAVEISLCYAYRPATVTELGVVFIEFGDDGAKTHAVADWPEYYAADASRPVCRFSPFKGWMNDPNGLCRWKGLYHLFYQFHPNSMEWGPMHWGHAISRDLHHWTHLPVFLHPQSNLAAIGATGGAFSGTAFVNPDGELAFFHTERLPAYDLYRNYKEIQKRVIPSADLVAAAASETILEHGPEGCGDDFRDPRIWFDEASRSYRMVLGAAIDGHPAVLLYRSEDCRDWTYREVLFRAPDRFKEHGARCVECPDFFELDGRWVLVMGFVGFKDPDTGRHNLLYAATGTFDGEQFAPCSGDLQELDFGSDFYAMQTFDDGGRRIAFAWLFNWEFRKPGGSPYSGELSLPRELSLTDRGLVRMVPAGGFEYLRERAFPLGLGRHAVPSGAVAIEIRVAGALDGLEVTIASGDGAEARVVHLDDRLWIELPEDDGSIRYCSRAARIDTIQLVIDRGVVEVFANQGELCGTRRSYRMGDPVAIEVSRSSTDGVLDCAAFALGSAWR